MLRISVDFNSITPDGDCVQINTNYHSELLGVLQEGMKVILYTEHDIQVEAILETIPFNGEIFWYGRADWSTLEDLA